MTRLNRVVTYAILISFSFMVIVPLLLLLGAAFSPVQSGRIELGDLNYSNFVNVWREAEFGRHLLVSLRLCTLVVVITLIITTLAAYAIAILNVPGSKWIFTIILAGLMIPLESILVPLYFTLRAMPFGGGATTLLIAHVGLNVSFGVFWMRATFLAIPKSLIESASIDGASPFKTFRMIVLPLTKPALITLGLLTFLWTWNDYFLAVILITDPDQLPVTLAIGEFATKYSNKYNLMSAAAVLVALPVVTLYIFFQRKFIQGVLTGALKG